MKEIWICSATVLLHIVFSSIFPEWAMAADYKVTKVTEENNEWAVEMTRRTLLEYHKSDDLQETEWRFLDGLVKKAVIELNKMGYISQGPSALSIAEPIEKGLNCLPWEDPRNIPFRGDFGREFMYFDCTAFIYLPKRVFPPSSQYKKVKKDAYQASKEMPQSSYSFDKSGL